MRNLNLIVFSVFLLFLNVSYGAEELGDLLNCPNVIDVQNHQGQTYLSFMKKIVKPKLDDYAINGYQVADADSIMATLNVVSNKVKRKAIRGAKGLQRLKTLAENLEGQKVTLYNLPDLIAGTGPGYDRYGLSTYIGLASCGGAILKYYDDNYAYNIHYGTGKVDKDERTGRSFGAGPSRNADDASDKAYLTDLEEFVTSENEVAEFYKTLMQSLTNTDTSNFKNVSDFGQTVLTDFLAVFTAEQDRNLMDGRISLHWDAALLEVTLLAAFHAGQEEIKLLYRDPVANKIVFTDSVYKQVNGCELQTATMLPRKASLIDYWQFSKNDDPEHCRRSGINTTKKEFRTLGRSISTYMKNNHRDLHNRVVRHWYRQRSTGNIFMDVSKFLINSRTKRYLGGKAYRLSSDLVNYLQQVKASASDISSLLARRYNNLPARP